jgi:hypothetical protein
VTVVSRSPGGDVPFAAPDGSAPQARRGLDDRSPELALVTSG